MEGQTICSKEALMVAGAVVQEWILKHGTLSHCKVIGEQSLPQLDI